MNFFRPLLILGATLLAACSSPGAIGVAYNQAGVVRIVFPDSPAQVADIRVADVILNTGQLRGPVGTICTVKGRRAGVEYTKAVKRVHVDSLKTW